jgi:hypothetical protein
MKRYIMMSVKNTILGLFFILLIINPSCKCSKDKPTDGNVLASKAKVEVKIHIERFEKDLFSLDLDSIDKKIPQLTAKYGEFFEMFCKGMLKVKSSDPRVPLALKKFLTDYFISLDYNKVSADYPNLD